MYLVEGVYIYRSVSVKVETTMEHLIHFVRILNLLFSKNEAEKIYWYVDGFRGFYLFVYFEVVWGGGGV